MWSLQKNAVLYSWHHNEDRSDGIIAAAISENEKYALTAQREALVWWRILDGRNMRAWKMPAIQSLCISKDGQFAVIGLREKAIYFALGNGKALLEFEHSAPVNACDLSSDGRYALTGSRDKSAKLWRLSDGKKLRTFNHRFEIAALALDPKNRYVLTNEALGQTRLWSIESGKLKKVIGPPQMTLSVARFSPDGRYLATGHVSEGIDLWEVKSGKRRRHWNPDSPAHWPPAAASISALSFANQGKYLLSALSRGSVQLWKI